MMDICIKCNELAKAIAKRSPIAWEEAARPKGASLGCPLCSLISNYYSNFPDLVVEIPHLPPSSDTQLLYSSLENSLAGDHEPLSFLTFTFETHQDWRGMAIWSDPGRYKTQFYLSVSLRLTLSHTARRLTRCPFRGRVHQTTDIQRQWPGGF
jgi:hypothetical protein